jgi:hypothetical protein
LVEDRSAIVEDTSEDQNTPSSKKSATGDLEKLARPVSEDFEMNDSYYEDDYTEDYNDSFMDDLQETVLEGVKAELAGQQAEVAGLVGRLEEAARREGRLDRAILRVGGIQMESEHETSM